MITTSVFQPSLFFVSNALNFMPLIPSMSNNTAPSGIVSASPGDNDTQAWQAFGAYYNATYPTTGNDSVTSGWSVNPFQSSASYIQYQFPYPRMAVAYLAYEVTNTNMTGSLQGSNDGVNWKTLFINNISSPGVPQIPEPAYYSYYRVYIFPLTTFDMTFFNFQLWGY